jgi:hypothetical protein
MFLMDKEFTSKNVIVKSFSLYMGTLRPVSTQEYSRSFVLISLSLSSLFSYIALSVQKYVITVRNHALTWFDNITVVESIYFTQVSQRYYWELEVLK